MFLSFIMWFISQEARHDRVWEISHKVLPYVTQQGDQLTFHNVRDFDYDEEGNIIPNYVDKTYLLSEVATVDFIVSHFSEVEGIAHTFLSFGFENGEYLSISVETRREDDEEFSPLLGLLRQFEIIYIVGTEQDLIGSRLSFRDEDVFLYPVQTSADKAQALLLEFVHEINNIYQKPQFYNTVTNNCTNAITRKVEKISDVDFPMSYKILLPGYSDELAYEMKLIPHDQALDKIRERHNLSRFQEVSRDDVLFSQKIRDW